MDFAWKPEQEQLRADVVAFAQAELNAGLEQRDRDAAFSLENWRKCAAFGLLGAHLPETYGGRGLDLLTTVAMLEGLGYGCRDAGLTLGVNALLWTILEPILTYGNAEQKMGYLPRFCRGELLAADAISEPQAGSDALAMQTTAVREGDTYVLNGRKAWIGLAPEADLFLLFAKTNPKAGAWGISVFLVDAGLPGITRSANCEKMGLRTLPMGEITLQDCHVPAHARLGPEGIGAALFNRSAEYERCFIQASNVGAMERQLEDALAHARSRKQFGQPIGDFQAVSHRLADMRVRLETARLFLYKAAWRMQQAESDPLHAAMTKLVVSETFLASSLDAVRLFGARGYTTEFGIERDLRDAMGGVIYAGTSDIQRNLIARHLGL